MAAIITGMAATEGCLGDWGNGHPVPVSEDPEDRPAWVLTCSGCGQVWVIMPDMGYTSRTWSYPDLGYLAPGTSAQDAVRQALASRR